MFPADSNSAPYPTARTVDNVKALAAPPMIAHANTRLPDEEDSGPSGGSRSSRRGSSPARSWVDAAVRGTPCMFPNLLRVTINDLQQIAENPTCLVSTIIPCCQTTHRRRHKICLPYSRGVHY